ncbi:MAG: IS3 family transposase [Chlamydiia bacterium]|nr:IS3 family transposase [Chlamydiia bacterium]
MTHCDRQAKGGKRFFKESACQLPLKERQALVKMKNRLSIKRRSELLRVNRSSVYYQHKNVEDVELMNEIRELYEQKCFYGYRRITEVLKRQGIKINRKKVLRLMQQLGLQAVYPKKKISKRAEGHQVYPYLLKEQIPKEPDDCWQVDITYIRVGNGYAYLVALIDCVSRRVMGWNLSPFLETSSCIEALNWGLKEGQPTIVNSDQGSQFTSMALLTN